MEIILYQINSERDYEECEFMDYDYTQEHGGIDPYAYDRVWSGNINADTLEEVYAKAFHITKFSFLRSI